MTDRKFDKVKLELKYQLMEYAALAMVILTLLGCFLKVVFI